MAITPSTYALNTPRFPAFTFANFPLASENRSKICIATDQNSQMYYSDGTNWKPVGNYSTANAPQSVDTNTYPPIYTGVSTITGLVGDYNADSIGLADGALVPSWPDDTGSGNTLTQGTPANQPTYKLKQINGHAAVRFSLANTFIGAAAFANASYTLVMVARFGGAINKFALETGSNSGSFVAGNQGQLRGNASNMAANAGVGWAVYRIVFTTGVTTAPMYRNGILVGMITALTAGMTRLTLGANTQSSPAFFFDGDIARVLVLNRAVTVDEGVGLDRELGLTYCLNTRQSGASGITPRTRQDSITMSDGNKATIFTPDSYIPGNPCPLIQVSHGNGSSDTCISITGGPMAMTDLLLSMGFIVAASDGGGTTVIGNSVQRAADAVLLAYLQSNYTIGRIVLAGQSAGGLCSLKRLLIDNVPNVVGWIGWYPATNLQNAADTWATGQALIGTAYGVATPYNSNAANFRGIDLVEGPETYQPSAFKSIRFRMYASPGDTTVSKARNSDLFALQLAQSPLVREVNVVAATGLHGDPSHFQPMDVAQFLQRCLNDPLSQSY